MSDDRNGTGRNKAGWEHSRYKNWRPSHVESTRTGRPDGAEPRRPRPRSLSGMVFRALFWVAVILAIAGPGGDYANGRLKAAGGACAVQVVVDGGRLITGCPDGTDLPQRIAGYAAPALLAPACLDEFGAGVLAALELRKILYAADTVVLRGPRAGPAEVPASAEEDAPESDGGTDAEADAEPAAETAADSDAEPVADPVPAAPEGALRVLVDGTDLAGPMLASGRVRPEDAAGWCE